MSKSSASRSSFRVIDGGAQKLPAWQDLPSTVLGRSPFSREQLCRYRFAQHDLRKDAQQKKYQPFFSAWSLVLGRLPPVPNASRLGSQLQSCPLTSLEDAHACFRGVKRPIADDNHGFDVFAFITKPKFYAKYAPGMVCQVALAPVPSDLVFVTYVRIDHNAGGRKRLRSEPGARLTGIVTHWGLVEACPLNPDLPIDHEERYRTRVW
jgi:hypothetical protein